MVKWVSHVFYRNQTYIEDTCLHYEQLNDLRLLWGGNCSELLEICSGSSVERVACGVWRAACGVWRAACGVLTWRTYGQPRRLMMSRRTQGSEVRGSVNSVSSPSRRPAGLHLFPVLRSSAQSPHPPRPPRPATDVLSNVTDCCNLDSRQPLSKLPESLRGLVSLTHD